MCVLLVIVHPIPRLVDAVPVRLHRLDKNRLRQHWLLCTLSVFIVAVEIDALGCGFGVQTKLEELCAARELQLRVNEVDCTTAGAN